MVDISVVIPVYNEELTLEELFSRLMKLLENDLSSPAEAVAANEESKESQETNDTKEVLLKLYQQH